MRSAASDTETERDDLLPNKNKAQAESLNSILVLEKAIHLLECFDIDHKEFGVRELSKETGINKSTVSRILSTLANNRLLIKPPKNGKYRLGIRLFELGTLVSSNMDLQKEALPFMEELSAKVEETVLLVVMDDFEVVYINKVESSQSLRAISRVGGRLPAHCTGVGKVLLAALSPEELNTFLLTKVPIKSFTQNTITRPEKLRKVLDQIRLQGYALDNEEYSEGLMCVAGPIFNHSGTVVGAISISGPTKRMKKKKIKTLISLVKTAAAGISNQLGFSIQQLPFQRDVKARD